MKWKLVKNEKPSHIEIILTYTLTGIEILQYLDGQFYHYEKGFIQSDVITHWMPLPKPPTKQ